MKTLISLLKEIEYLALGNKELLYLQVSGICADSRKANERAVFFCLAGARNDGHSFANLAYKKGVRAFVSEHKLTLPNDSIQIIVKNSRKALALASAEFFSHPEKNLILIGVTGTKGKSTVCEMISKILNSAGKKCAVISTLGIKIGNITEETENSTPESYVIYKALAKICSYGIKYAVIEVSSQALASYRTEGLHFDAAIFTNLSRDHIGSYEHPNFIHYKESKKLLFSRAKVAFINSDDPFSCEFSRACSCPIFLYGTKKNADIFSKNPRYFRQNDIFGISFVCEANGEKAQIKLPVPGEFSVLNATAAIAVSSYFGVSLKICATALSSVNISGRFEIVPCASRDITCIIDYAHNGKSFENVLTALREYKPHKIICVFGSVGGRTKERRRELGSIAARLADFCIVTSDNPDFEAPEEIAREISLYIPPEKYICILDRAEAISYALDVAEHGDFLLFAGKGHEQYQLVNGKKLPFSERELIKNHKFAEKLIPFP